MLYRRLGKEHIYQLSSDLRTFAVKALPGIATLTAVLMLCANVQWETYNAGGRLFRLLAIMLVSAIAYAFVLLISGIRPRQLANP